MRQLELGLSHFRESEGQRLRYLMEEYAHIFALSSSELGATNVVTHCIDIETTLLFDNLLGESHLLFTSMRTR